MATIRRDHAREPGLCDRVFELLEEPFPGVSLARRAAEQFGAPWEAASTPFVIEVDGELVSHVGLLELPLRIDGADIVVGGVHGVVTRRRARRSGHYRRAMDELLAHADGSYPTLVLTTVHPEYFEAFGFRVVHEHVFTHPVTHGVARPGGRPADRRAPAIDLGRADDRALAHRLLAERAPVSDRLGVGPERCAWAFNEAGSDLRYAAELHTLISGELVERTLRLYDLVGPAVPALDRVLAAWGEPVDRVVTFFSPDQLGAPFSAVPHDLDGGPDALEPGVRATVLMVRGPWPSASRPAMLPRPGRC